MTPKELALRCPRLYHITEPGAWQSIQQHGLLSTNQLLHLYEIPKSHRDQIELKPRPKEIRLEHHQHGSIIINDNVPLSEEALAKCLDDGLSPADWLHLLNSRVFFWPSEKDLNQHLNARLNRQRSREVIVVDTLSLAEAHGFRMELSPINSGATLRKAARRGLQTFTPLCKYSYKDWRKLRGRTDSIREIIVHNAVIDITSYVLEVYQTNVENKSITYSLC